MPSNKQITSLLIISAIIFTAFGYWGLPKIISQSAIRGNLLVSKTPSNTFVAGLTAAYNRLIARGHADIAASGFGYRESKTIGGKINEIKDNKISLQVYPVNALADPGLDTRTVAITTATKIYKQVEKTPEQMSQDSEAFSKQMQEFSQKMKDRKAGEPLNPPLPPEPFGKQEIKLTDLKADSQIMVTAKDNINAAKEFTALEIMAQ
jgi:hypothetical protein